jgi:hypothetical protein
VGFSLLFCVAFAFYFVWTGLDLFTLAKGPLDSLTKSSRPPGSTLLLALKTRVFDFDKRTKTYIYILEGALAFSLCLRGIWESLFGFSCRRWLKCN